jgi:hypothetical protein
MLNTDLDWDAIGSDVWVEIAAETESLSGSLDIDQMTTYLIGLRDDLQFGDGDQ